MTPAEMETRLASRLKMRHLMLLRMIAEHGSLTRVSHRMATSQPAVTHALAELESMYELDCVIGRASAVLDMQGLEHEVLYHQEPRLITHRRLAARLGRQPLAWQELARLEWILGARQTPMREQITDFFLRAGVAPPAPFVESLSSKLIGELIAANEKAVSIVPADIAEELARIAGVGIVAHRFGWTLPPITLFQRTEGARYEEQSLFVAALRAVCARQAAAQAGDAA
ncbi:hypothetical protein AVHY2522_23550 [Acidovorax sp. SUPP2522]|uniref:LysR family transcriptional regulator n=1 Tax=unclassified Acidovorax TaxID=2684926 RepID=UPI002349CE4D|nr:MULTISPECIES: LysR family transcriptional regulator [unclassified Acidovorax]WCM96699.1 LysR family transcriptional regulator [Acidovorax sp. GBBC 1281]GKT19732.1 hypothetical protein AVHY2522_23550 [Acidovorax sp. SUPP2522]